MKTSLPINIDWVVKFYKKVFFKRQNRGVSFLAATKMATKFARIAILLSRFIFLKKTIYLVLLFGGFNEGVLPGVFLLSRCRWSGLPVDVAILLGPGLSAIVLGFIYVIKNIIYLNAKGFAHERGISF